jgi:hypothetical protein
MIAAEICGVQPMIGPASQIFTMRARYGNQIPGCHSGCDFSFGEQFMHFVDIDVSVDFDFSEIIGWANKNLTGSFNYNREWPQWRWFFTSKSDAMMFKLRWG